VRSISLLLVSVACGPSEPAHTAPAPAPRQPERSAEVVNATVLANGCQELGKTNAKLAEKAMYELVEGCSTVPGGSSRFSATLLPGGRIDIQAGPGQPDVVPICILKHPLAHQVPLVKPCRLDVKIDQTSLPVVLDAGT
jgi:hypothetical protein